LSNKKLFDGRGFTQEEHKNVKKIGSNLTQREHKIVIKAPDNYTQKVQELMKETGGNFSQKEPKYVVSKTNYLTIKSVNPRLLSFFILNRYFSEKSNLKFILNDSLKKYDLTELDRRFVFEVVKGTVRYFIRIDFLISLFSNKTVKSLDGDVLNILRQAVYQLLYMNKTPAYAAVLRKINTVPKIQEFLDISIKNACIKPVERLSVMYSYPEWLAEYWEKSFGIERTEFLFSSLNCEPQVFIRVNRLKTDKIKLIKIFKDNGMLQGRDFFSEPFEIFETTYNRDKETVAGTAGFANSSKITVGTAGNITSDDSTEISSGNAVSMGNYKKTGLFGDCIILKSVQNIEKIPGYLLGHFSVQDFSSQFAVKYFLCPTGSDKILDICSAPGGKATYMAELTDGRAEILSVDINTKKMDLLEENIARLGINNITILNADVTNAGFLGDDRFENYFDKIFIDAPCSALGTVSKNPDAKYACTVSDMERLGEITGKMLSAADKYLKPGGIIILYKCTLSEIENQEYVKKFIEHNPGKYRIEYPFLHCMDIATSADLSDSQGFLQESRIADSEEVNLKKDSILQLAARLGPLLKKAPLFEIMPDYFSSEAGFVCILKKLVL
jgi:16S rRNA (cytosine967-C5)-methyltransferase